MTGLPPAPRVPFLDLRVSQQPLDRDFDALWHRVTRSSGFVGGSEVEAFEQEWATTCRTSHAVGTANGTDAIELALTALGAGPGDEVVVPTNSFIATAEAVVATGATPVFADVDDRTLLLTPETLEAAITARTTAVAVVHLYGQVADMPGLGAVARKAGIAVIEDCAQAQGACWDGRPAGSFGDMGCFSFYPGKNLGAFGDAGAVVTSDAGLARRVRQLGNHGRSAASRYEHAVVGRNSRLDALQAGVLRIKLRHLETWNASRGSAHQRYADNLVGHPVVRPVVQDQRSLSSHHLEVVRVPDRDAVLGALGREGVDAAVHYPIPCHLNSGYSRYERGPLPVSERAAGELLSLPIFPGITTAQVDRVCEALDDVLTRTPSPGSSPRPAQESR